MTPSEVHLCGRAVGAGRHVCALVTSRDEEYAIRAPYVREGVEQGDLVLEVVETDAAASHAARMRRANGASSRPKGRAEVRTLTEDEVYLPRGYFDQERMLELVAEASAEAASKGHPRLRTFGSMSWAAKGPPGSEQVLEYEARVNQLVVGKRDVFVCAYDVARFPASTILDMVRTHPAVIVGGVYHDNPYYIPPETLLRELAARGLAKNG